MKYPEPEKYGRPQFKTVLKAVDTDAWQTLGEFVMPETPGRYSILLLGSDQATVFAFTRGGLMTLRIEWAAIGH